MTEAGLLSDVLKSAPTATSLSGLSTLLVKSSGELAKFPGKMTMEIHPAFSGNLDELTETGWYPLTGSTKNGPSFINSGDNLLVLSIWQAVTIQILFGYFHSYIAKRCLLPTGWTAWKSILLT